MARMVPVSESGRVVGENAPNAKYSDALINQIRDMHEYQGLGYWKIARQLDLPVHVCRKVVYYQRRATVPRGFRKVEDDER